MADILEGLTAEQKSKIRFFTDSRLLPQDALLYQEGDPADGLFVVLAGRLLVYTRRKVSEERDPVSKKLTARYEEVRLQEIATGEIIGEGGLLKDHGNRLASVRALETSSLLHIKPNMVEFFANQNQLDAGVRIMENLFRAVAEKLRARADQLKVTRSIEREKPLALPKDPHALIEEVESLFPRKGFFTKSLDIRKAPAGSAVMAQGRPVEMIGFLLQGALRLTVADQAGASRDLENLLPPAIFGVLPFFANSPAISTATAATDVEYACLTRGAYEKLKKSSREDAMRLLMCCASLVVYFILRLQQD